MSQTLKQEDNLYLQLNVIKVSETFRIASCGFPLSWVSHSTISGNSLECILICFFVFFFFRVGWFKDDGCWEYFYQACHNLTTQKHAERQKLFKANWREMSSKKKEKKVLFVLRAHSRLGSHGAQTMNHTGGWLFCLLLSYVFFA